MEQKIPEIIPETCGECRYFKNTGLLDKYSGNCQFYDQSRYANWACLAKEFVSVKDATETDPSVDKTQTPEQDIVCPECNHSFTLKNELTSEIVCPNCNSKVEKPTIKEPANFGFNWGAFFFPAIWLLFNGKAGMGFLIIGYNVFSRIFYLMGPGGVVVDLMISLFIMFYLATNANRYIWEKDQIMTIEQVKEAQSGWNIAGLIIGIPLYIIIFIFAFSR